MANWYDEEEKYRELRGGSWYLDSSILRAAYRYRYLPGLRLDLFGFRCVRDSGAGLPACAALLT